MILLGKEITTKDVPGRWAVCFLEGCPRCEQCLRHAVVPMMAEHTRGQSVYPAALSVKGGCPHFTPIRVNRYAWGMSSLFTNVLMRDAPIIRKEIVSILGSRATYYRYNKGIQKLSPYQQRQILAIFARRGYTEGLTFEHYIEVIDFNA